MSVVARSGNCLLWFRAKAVPLWKSEGNMRPEISSLSEGGMPEGVTCWSEFNRANFLLL